MWLPSFPTLPHRVVVQWWWCPTIHTVCGRTIGKLPTTIITLAFALAQKLDEIMTRDIISCRTTSSDRTHTVARKLQSKVAEKISRSSTTTPSAHLLDCSDGIGCACAGPSRDPVRRNPPGSRTICPQLNRSLRGDGRRVAAFVVATNFRVVTTHSTASLVTLLMRE